MRLQSITVRNYRIHREARVDLDPQMTLVGGPNESGKSTLIEAAHRALFLRAGVGGKVRDGMVSTVHNGHPEVEVEFEAGGTSFRVSKRFSGQNGTVRLAEAGCVPLNGASAEDRLQQLLGSEQVGGGGAADRLKSQWGHLWAWQGEAGDDPTGHANNRHAELVARLQAQGGAVVLQSAIDAQAADRFAQFVKDNFKDNKQPKAGSELGQAQAAADAAGASKTAAQDAFDRLEQAMLDCTEAEKEIARIKAVLPGVRAELAEVDRKLAMAMRLEGKVQSRLQFHQRRADTHKALGEADKRIAGLRAAIAEAESALGPKDVETGRLRDVLEQCHQSVGGKVTAWDAAVEAATLKRRARDLAQAFVSLFEKRKGHAEIKARHDQVVAERDKLGGFQAQLAALAVVGKKDVDKLRNLRQDLSNAESALTAMAAEIEVVAADMAVRIGGEGLAPGASRLLAGEAEITVGEGVRLRVRPGGGTSLGDARIRRIEAAKDMKAMLGKLGIESVEAAEEALARRTQLETDVRATQKTLDALGAETIDQNLAQAVQAAFSAQAEVDQRLPGVLGFEPSSSLGEAEGQHRDLKSEAEAAEKAEREARESVEAARSAETKADNALKGHIASIQQEQQEWGKLRAQLAVLLGTHGEDDERAASLQRHDRRKQRSESLVSATRRKLADLQPDLLRQGQAMLHGSVTTHDQSVVDQGIRKAGALALLKTNGTSNPAADLANAKMVADRARDRLALVKRRTDAVRRLHELFTEEQQQLAERFNRPLADKIAGYLQCLFGPDARVKVESNGTAFSGISVIRPTDGGGATEFDVLSGGAKEQVGAAVRLAVAEILAEDHGGTLPVVFDDAFAYSDPDRVKGVQRMLFQASQRGLQVIVLACNPNDYVGLGAATVQLRPPLPSPAGSRPLPSAAAETTEVDDTRDENKGSFVEVTDDLRQEFLQALAAAGGSSGNMKLRSTLDWDAQCYDAVRDDLVASGHVKKGQGKGGSVRLT